jgi:hypothetical protein
MLEGLTPPIQDRLCVVMSKASGLDAKDLTILEEALQDTRWSNNGLADALRSRGFEVSESSIRKHRGKKCCCAR